MDAEKLYLNDFNEVFNEKKESLKVFLNNTKELSLKEILVDYFEIIKKAKNPNYKTEKYLELNNNELLSFLLTDDFLEFVYNNLNKDVEVLSVPMEFINKYPNFNEKFNNIKKLDINSTIHNNELDNLDNINIKDISAKSLFIITNNKEKPFDKIYISMSTFHELINKNSVIHTNDEIMERQKILVNATTNNINDNRLKEFISKYFSDDAGLRIAEDGKTLISYDKDFGFTLDISIGIDNIITWVNLISNLGISNNKITVNCENKTYDNIDKLKQINNLSIKYSTYSASVDEFITMRENFDYYINLINNSGLTEAEKVMYVYDIVKWFSYNESEDKTESRALHEIFKTGHIVCVGYAAFMEELLIELGIPSYKLSVSVPLSDGTIAGHARNLVEVNDDHYGIHGMYAFDPTWDSATDYLVQDKNTGNVGYARKNPETGELDESLEIIKEVDPTSRYGHSFVPKDQYLEVFAGESLPTIYNSEVRSTEDGRSITEFISSATIPRDTRLRLILNTRLKEGYSKEQVEELYKELTETNEILKKYNGKINEEEKNREEIEEQAAVLK